MHTAGWHARCNGCMHTCRSSLSNNLWGPQCRCGKVLSWMASGLPASWPGKFLMQRMQPSLLASPPMRSMRWCAQPWHSSSADGLQQRLSTACSLHLSACMFLIVSASLIVMQSRSCIRQGCTWPAEAAFSRILEAYRIAQWA